MDSGDIRKFRNTKQSVHLPQEIIEEILSRLGVKPLLRLRCVSKSWRSLITSKRFIKTQLQNTTKKTSLAHHRVIFCSESAATKKFFLHSLLNEADIPATNQLKICSLSTENSLRVVGCCNGLLCLLIFPAKIFLLWNPATRISIELPKTDFGITKYGFGLDEKSGAYKVFVVAHVHKQMIGKVYSTNSNSWKIIERGAFIWPDGAGQFVCGKIHWYTININGHHIESFHLESEEFGRIELFFDSYDNWCDMKLGEIGGCLCVSSHHVKESRIDVWVMKEYGVKESWFKLLTVPPLQLKLLNIRPYESFQLNPLLGEGPNGEILLMEGDRFLVYNSKDNEFSAVKTIKSLGEYNVARVYVESLVSPAPDKNLTTIC